VVTCSTCLWCIVYASYEYTETYTIPSGLSSKTNFTPEHYPLSNKSTGEALQRGPGNNVVQGKCRYI
jgi:hypothetical protein